MKNFSCTSFLFLPLLSSKLLPHTERHYPLHMQLMHTHNWYLFRFSDRLVSNIPGWCKLIQNSYTDNWEFLSYQPHRNNVQRLQDKSIDKTTLDCGWLKITSLKTNMEPCSNCLSLFLKCQTFCFVPLGQQHFGLPLYIHISSVFHLPEAYCLLLKHSQFQFCDSVLLPNAARCQAVCSLRSIIYIHFC